MVLVSPSVAHGIKINGRSSLPQRPSICCVLRMVLGQVTLREGERRRGYDVSKYYKVRDERFPDRYSADITFQRLQALDVDNNAQHILKVKNSII